MPDELLRARKDARVTVLKRLFKRRGEGAEAVHPTVAGRPARVPDGVRVYAIGDIHGRADLLLDLGRLIAADAAKRDGATPLVVYVGDYVDRGYDSRLVIQHLIDRPIGGFEAVHLRGNHDAWMLGFLSEPSIGANWLRFGGDTTLLSYGVRPGGAEPLEEDMGALRDALLAKLPAGHLALLDSMQTAFELGDYLFVHAGVRPGVPLDMQHEQDMLWIREPFLTFDGEFGKIVVHGHTVEPEPVVRPNRIGIDTGACWTGRLTCLVLEGGGHRFLATGAGA